MASQPTASAPPNRASIFSLVASLNPVANASIAASYTAGGGSAAALSSSGGMSPQSAPPLIHMMHRQFQGDTRAMLPSITGPRASLQATGSDTSMLSRLASVVATSPALVMTFSFLSMHFHVVDSPFFLIPIQQSSVAPRSAVPRSAFSLLNFPASSTPGGRADLINFPATITAMKSEPAASSPGLPLRVTVQPKRPFEPQSTSPSYLLQSARSTPALSLLRPPSVGGVSGPASVSGEGSVAQRYQQRVQELLQNQTSSTSGQLRVPTSPLPGFNSTFSPQLPLPSQIHNTEVSVPSLAPLAPLASPVPPMPAAPLSTGIELNAQHLALLQMQMQIQLQMQAQAAAAGLALSVAVLYQCSILNVFLFLSIQLHQVRLNGNCPKAKLEQLPRSHRKPIHRTMTRKIPTCDLPRNAVSFHLLIILSSNFSVFPFFVMLYRHPELIDLFVWQTCFLHCRVASAA
jgi:hypothetical protein